MADNFDLRQFLTENKLTKNAQLLNEEVSLNGKPVDVRSIEIDGIDMNDYPDFVDAYIIAADYEDGTPLSDDEVQQFQDENYDLVGELIHDRQLYLEGEGVNEAKGYSFTFTYNDAEYVQQVLDNAGVDAVAKPGTFDDEVIVRAFDGMGLRRAKQALEADHFDISENVNEASYKVSKNSKEAQHLKKGDIIGSGEEVVSVSAGAKTPKGKVEVTLKTKDGKTKTSTWGKTTKIGVKEKETETVKENKMTQRDKYLTRLVENALGLTNNDEDQEFDPGHDIEQAQHNIERQYEGDEMVNEKPLPKYENIEKLMQEIDKSTDEEAHKFKMQEMKRVADMLEKKCTALEEGDDADHIDQKKLKQMKKDIMALRKGIEKMEKLGEKKFTKKETKAEMKEGFDLRKFLVENKLTTNSRMLNELSPELLGRAAEKAKSQGRTLQANKFSNAALQQTYKAAAIEKNAKMEPMKPFQGKELNLYYDIKTDQGIKQAVTVPHKIYTIEIDQNGAMGVQLTQTSNNSIASSKAFFFIPEADHYKLSAGGFTHDNFLIRGLDQAGAQLLWKLAKAFKPDTQVTPNTLVDGAPTPLAGKAFQPTPAQ